MTDVDRLIGFMAIMQVPFMNNPDALAYIEEIKTVLKQVKAQEPGWISVKDKLPPMHDLVIVSINDDRGDNDYRYIDTGWYLTEGKCWIVDNEATINVEAWMPFPKPYKPPKEET